jgi:hypothetical protein
MSYLLREELLDRLDRDFDIRLLYPERIDRQDLQAIYDALQEKHEVITDLFAEVEIGLERQRKEP